MIGKIIAYIKIYGVWSEESGAWVRDVNGQRIFYPSRVAAQSHADENPGSSWEAREMETIEVVIEDDGPKV